MPLSCFPFLVTKTSSDRSASPDAVKVLSSSCKNKNIESSLESINESEKIVRLLESLTQNLKNARLDDIIQCRTKDEWEILYSVRYMYMNVVNSHNNIFEKIKLNNLLLHYQELTETLYWHNPYSKYILVF